MTSLIALALFGVAFASNHHLRYQLPCTNSLNCTLRKPCCRDTNGKAIINLVGGFHLGDNENNVQRDGTCSSLLGKEGDLCDFSCGCQSGFKCYRPVSGACCPPTLCYNATWVEEQEQFWANCHPPKCFFPP